MRRVRNRKDNNMTTETNSSRPTHRIYAVTKNGNNTIWKSIGVLWAHRDGKGFNPKLNCIPLNSAEIVIREISDAAQSDDSRAP